MKEGRVCHGQGGGARPTRMRAKGAALIYRRHWREYGAAIRFAAILGLAFGTAAGAAVIQPPLSGALFGAMSGVTDFVTGMAMIGALEIFVPRTAYTACEFGPSAEEQAAERWIATREDLLAAIDRQHRMPLMRIGEALINLGLVTPKQVDRALSRQRGDQPLDHRPYQPEVPGLGHAETHDGLGGPPHGRIRSARRTASGLLVAAR